MFMGHTIKRTTGVISKSDLFVDEDISVWNTDNKIIKLTINPSQKYKFALRTSHFHYLVPVKCDFALLVDIKRAK